MKSKTYKLRTYLRGSAGRRTQGYPWTGILLERGQLLVMIYGVLANFEDSFRACFHDLFPPSEAETNPRGILAG